MTTTTAVCQQALFVPNGNSFSVPICLQQTCKALAGGGKSGLEE